MKKHASTIILIFIFLIGLSLLLYPAFSDWWNTFHQTQVIDSYSAEVANLDDEKYAEIWEAAYDYNASLMDRFNRYVLPERLQEEYNQLLNLRGLGIMGYIEIPTINVILPIYHGTSEAVLQVGIGHLEWTSLPVGGESSHCVLSGHRGLPTATLFTNLDKLVVGDLFYIKVMDEVLTYWVDQILIVEPRDTEDLMIVEGEDLCTLITCTPYGINTHRLLVRGHRIDTVEASKLRITADAAQIEPVIVAPVVAAPMLLIALIILMIPKRRKAEGGNKNEEADIFSIDDIDLDLFFRDESFGA